MKNIRILVDTNIVLDYIANREPFAEYASKIIKLCIGKKIQGCMSAHTVTNLFFILRKDLTVEKRKETLRKICRIFEVVGIDYAKLENALENDGFDDLEDCLQDECAKDFESEYIVTRNTKDFKNSSVKAIEPQDFLKIFEDIEE